MRIKNINEIARCVLSCSDTCPDFLELIDDYDYFDDVHGYLSEENALALITESYERSELGQLLPQMFYFSNISTISETVFAAIMSYSVKEIQQDILIALSHCRISFYQLDIICRKKICIEAFAALLDIYLNESCFSTVDLSKLLCENTEFIHGIAWDMVLANEKLERNKIEIIQEYVSLNTGG